MDKQDNNIEKAENTAAAGNDTPGAPDENENDVGGELGDDLGIEETDTMAEAQDFLHELEEPPKKKRFAEELFDLVEVFANALMVVILLLTFVFRMVTVEGASMQETLQPNDRLMISLFYTPAQNDIVVIQVPNPAFAIPIIKRVIATEGQTVDFNFETWTVYVDGVALDEPYVNYMAGMPMRSGDSRFIESLPITVEPGKIFVLGDNRNQSSDSRNYSIGQVEVRDVVGRVMFRILPIRQFGLVRAHEE